MVPKGAERASLVNDVPASGFAPVGHTLVIDWAPTLRYYEHRLEPLVRLEDRHLLRSFRVTPDEVGGRLAASELSIRSSRLSLVSPSPTDEDVCLTIIRDVIETLRPKQFTQLAIWLQYVVPLADVSYDRARQKGLEVFEGVDMAGAGATDFAFILTGDSEHLQWNLEAGIIAQNEVVPRVLRQVGGYTRVPSSPVVLEALGSPPPVAFFCDSAWFVKNIVPSGDSVEWLLENLSEIQDQARRVIPRIHEGITHSAPAREGVQ